MNRIKLSQKWILFLGIFLFFCLGSYAQVAAAKAKAPQNWIIPEPINIDLGKISTILKFTIIKNFLSALAASIAVLFIVIAGIRYVMAKGPEEAQAAKGALFNALIGLAIVTAAWGLFSLVAWLAQQFF
jgi:hypothetical protein